MQHSTLWAVKGTINDAPKTSKLNGSEFLYIGVSMTRADAIRNHTFEKQKTWEQCLKNGDDTVKVLVEPTEPLRQAWKEKK